MSLPSTIPSQPHPLHTKTTPYFHSQGPSQICGAFIARTKNVEEGSNPHQVEIGFNDGLVSEGIFDVGRMTEVMKTLEEGHEVGKASNENVRPLLIKSEFLFMTVVFTIVESTSIVPRTAVGIPKIEKG
ncbi:hypothetical protein V6N12_046024 [Hibiscus sabdariffa]|uniref:Uncharacterized protein n=1 Tax=Hibiscus sabdariffa TaxID=183260 RepID=A0ABR2G4J6_9ROSI